MKNKYKLGSFTTKIGSGVTPKGGETSYKKLGTPLIRSQNVLAGVLDLSDVAYIDDAQHQRMSGSIVRPYDVLLNITGASIGRCCLVPEWLEEANVNQHVCIIRPTANLNPGYLMQFLNSDLGQNLIASYQAGGNRQGLNYQQIASFEIPVPPLPEQERIAALLSTWDEAISKTQSLIEGKGNAFKRNRKELTQKPSASSFRQYYLSEIASEITRRGDGQDYPAMMISSTQGFIDQSEKYGRDMTGESLQKYILLLRGEFAYNRGNSKTYPYGCIFRLEQEHALIPFVYTCFSLNEGLEADYFRHYFEAGSLNRQLHPLISSSARGNGLLNISTDDFFSCKIPVPTQEYQKQCALYLNAEKQEMEILKLQLRLLQDQKQGLMQKLLSGTWSVPPAPQPQLQGAAR